MISAFTFFLFLFLSMCYHIENMYEKCIISLNLEMGWKKTVLCGRYPYRSISSGSEERVKTHWYWFFVCNRFSRDLTTHTYSCISSVVCVWNETGHRRPGPFFISSNKAIKGRQRHRSQSFWQPYWVLRANA